MDRHSAGDLGGADRCRIGAVVCGDQWHTSGLSPRREQRPTSGGAARGGDVRRHLDAERAQVEEATAEPFGRVPEERHDGVVSGEGELVDPVEPADLRGEREFSVATILCGQ